MVYIIITGLIGMTIVSIYAIRSMLKGR